jgi:hypothetical protein
MRKTTRTEQVLFYGLMTVIGLVSLWQFGRPALCPEGLGGNQGPVARDWCFEFWLNRYQSLLAGLLSLAAAGIAAWLVWRQFRIQNSERAREAQERAVRRSQETVLVENIARRLRPGLSIALRAMNFELLLGAPDWDRFATVHADVRKAAEIRYEIIQACRDVEARSAGGPDLAETVAAERERFEAATAALHDIRNAFDNQDLLRTGDAPDDEFLKAFSSYTEQVEECRLATVRAAVRLSEAAAERRAHLRAEIRALEAAVNV